MYVLFILFWCSATGIGSDSHSQSTPPPAKKNMTAEDESQQPQSKPRSKLDKHRAKGGFTGEAPRKITPSSKDQKPALREQSVDARSTEDSDKSATTTGLSVVDQTVDDLGPLNLSLRKPEVGIQLPTGFQKVFRLESESETGIGGRLLRANGGLAAVFDQSVYVRTEDGVLPDVPASTTWVIGGLPLGGESGHGMLLPIDPLDLGRLPLRRSTSLPLISKVAGSEAGFGPGARIPMTAVPGGSDFSLVQRGERSKSRFLHDRAYRASRMQQLLKAARVRLRNQPDDPSADPRP